MRTLFIVLFTSLFVISSVATSAQEPEPWSVEQHCIGDLTYPIVQQGSWDFPGVIISGYGNGSAFRDSGIRAARADIDTDYWLAMASAHSYPFSGALSPDNRYFAYPIGDTNFDVNTSGDELVSVDNVRIVRTDGDTTETHMMPGRASSYVSSLNIMPYLPLPMWFDNETIYYPHPGNDPVNILNFIKNRYVDWPYAFAPDHFARYSPDATRAFIYNADDAEYVYYGFKNYRFYNMETQQPYNPLMPDALVWLPDSSAYLASFSDHLLIMDRDGEQLDQMRDYATDFIALNHQSTMFAFWGDDIVTGENSNLYLADLQERKFYNLCFENHSQPYSNHLGPNLAFSPDDSLLAFSYDGYLVILDLETLENQVIDTPSGWVMGWGALDSETTEIVAPSFDWPTHTPTPLPTATTTPTPRPTMTLTPTATLPPTATLDPAAITCQLDVVVGANLRSGPGADNEHVGSAAEGFVLYAQAQQFNEAEYFIWWQLNTGEWIREDFVREGENCEFLPPPEAEEAP